MQKQTKDFFERAGLIEPQEPKPKTKRNELESVNRKVGKLLWEVVRLGRRMDKLTKEVVELKRGRPKM